VLVRHADPHVLTSGDSSRAFPRLVVALCALCVALTGGLLYGAVGAPCAALRCCGILRIGPLLLTPGFCFRLPLPVAGLVVTSLVVGGLSRLIGASVPVARLALLGAAVG